MTNMAEWILDEWHKDPLFVWMLPLALMCVAGLLLIFPPGAILMALGFAATMQHRYEKWRRGKYPQVAYSEGEK